MARLLTRDARTLALLTAVAATLYAVGPAGEPSPLRAAVYAAAVGIGLFLFAREALGDTAALAASLLLLAAAAQEGPGPEELRRGTLLVGSILFFLAAERSAHARPQPGLLLGGWLFLGASLLPNGVAGTLVIPLAVGAHLLLRPPAARVRFARTPIHLAGILLAGLAVGGFLAAAGPGTAVEWVSRVRHPGFPPALEIGPLPVTLLPFLPLAAASLIWAWRRARKDEAPFARTGLGWIAAAAVVGAGCLSLEAPAARLPLLVPVAILAGAWLDLAAERHPLGSPARWGVGGACLLAAAAGVGLLLERDPRDVAGTIDTFFFYVAPPTETWGFLVAGSLLLLGSAAAAVRLFLLAAPTRAVVDLVLAFAASGAVLGLASPW